MKCDNQGGRFRSQRNSSFGLGWLIWRRGWCCLYHFRNVDLGLKLYHRRKFCFFLFFVFRPDSALGTISKHDFNRRLSSFRHNLCHLMKRCFIVEIKGLAAGNCVYYTEELFCTKTWPVTYYHMLRRDRAATQVKFCRGKISGTCPIK